MKLKICCRCSDRRRNQWSYILKCFLYALVDLIEFVCWLIFTKELNLCSDLSIAVFASGEQRPMVAYGEIAIQSDTFRIWMLRILYNFTYHLSDKIECNSHRNCAAKVCLHQLRAGGRAWIPHKIRVILKFNWFQWVPRKCKHRTQQYEIEMQLMPIATIQMNQLHALPNKMNLVCYTFLLFCLRNRRCILFIRPSI